MGHLSSDRKRDGRSRHAPWVKVALAGWLALYGALAHAGVISLTTSQAGGVVTLTVTDSNPADMCAGGICAADFTIGFDPTVLEFILGSEASSFFMMAGPGASGEVLVTFVTLDAFNFAGGSEVLFSVGFNALLAQQTLVTIAPTVFDVVVPDQYLPAAADVSVDVVVQAVPEPNTALLAMLALACLAWRRRTNLAQDQRPLPTA